MEKLTVASVLTTKEVSGRFGPQIRSAFKTNEYGERILSTFAKYPVKAGQTIEGTVEEQEKDGKTYHHFKFAPRGSGSGGTGSTSGDLNRLETKIDYIISLLQKKEVKEEPKDDKDDWTNISFDE